MTDFQQETASRFDRAERALTGERWTPIQAEQLHRLINIGAAGMERRGLREAVRQFLPHNLNLHNRNVPDDMVVSLDVEIGELRALAVALFDGSADGEGSALADIAAERRRQVEAEGYDPAHDDEHDRDLALPRAAACYALAGTGGNGPFWINPGLVPSQVWPYRWEWKPYDRRRNLVRAGALIVAEIERVDRAALAREG